jgi:hypothetical protein
MSANRVHQRLLNGHHQRSAATQSELRKTVATAQRDIRTNGRRSGPTRSRPDQPGLKRRSRARGNWPDPANAGRSVLVVGLLLVVAFGPDPCPGGGPFVRRVLGRQPQEGLQAFAEARIIVGLVGGCHPVSVVMRCTVVLRVASKRCSTMLASLVAASWICLTYTAGTFAPPCSSALAAVRRSSTGARMAVIRSVTCWPAAKADARSSMTHEDLFVAARRRHSRSMLRAGAKPLPRVHPGRTSLPRRSRREASSQPTHPVGNAAADGGFGESEFSGHLSLSEAVRVDQP